MQSTNLTQGLSLNYADQPQNTPTDWDLSLPEVNPISIPQEKEFDCMYYGYGGAVSGMPMQEIAWGPVLPFGTSQNVCYGQDTDGKKKLLELEQQQSHAIVSSEEGRCGQLGCSNISGLQDVNGYCSLYAHERSEADILKQQQQNGIFLTEGDLAKLSDLAPDIMNLEGSVSSELLKVVDTDDDDEDLIVDDSDSESEISVSDSSTFLISSTQYELRCMICALPRSHTVEANFLHVDNTFPMTFVSKTPVITKLVEIIPSDMHPRLDPGENIICRRCFNLIDTAENLELRLTTVKQELCDFLSSTQRTKSIMGEGHLRDPQENLPYNVRETITCNSEALGGLQQPSQATELQRHINSYTSKCGITDGMYLPGCQSSLMYNSAPVDHRLLYPQNGVQFSPQKSSYISAMSTHIPFNDSSSYPLEIGFNSEQPRKDGRGKIDNTTINIENKDETTVPKSPEEVQMDSPNKELAASDKSDKTIKLSKNLKKKDATSLKCGRERYQCDRCGRTYCQKFKLTNHLKKHYGDFRFKCEYCSKGYSVELNLILHLRNHKDIRPYLCERCPASFHNSNDLQSHLIFCVDKMFPCSKCAKMFVSFEKLSEHNQAQHNKVASDLPIKKHECTICGKQFRYPADLADHSTFHETSRSHCCSICGRTYKYKRHLNRHHRDTHLKQCNEKKPKENSDDTLEHRSNATQSNVNNGKNSNNALSSGSRRGNKSGTKNVCPVCNKEVWKLKVHMMSHSSIKRFRCGVCKVEFTLKQGLVRHLRRKHV